MQQLRRFNPASSSNWRGVTSAWHLTTSVNIAADGSVPHASAVGAMGVRFGLHNGLNKTQIELLDAVRASEIKTFGWPFAVLLENRDEYKPRPLGDGIRAEVSIDEKTRKSYDYWAARKNGDLYATQGYFEDQREDSALFFNTRIVRVTEALMFASRFYTALGAAPDAKISARFTHSGLAGRTLKSASPNRRLSTSPMSHEKVSETETVIMLIHNALVDEVQRVCAPMFMLRHCASIRERRSHVSGGGCALVSVSGQRQGR
jgi:hypothetical protein